MKIKLSNYIVRQINIKKEIMILNLHYSLLFDFGLP